MIPVENSTAGRVADIHRLLPESHLNIIGEYFLRVQHCLLALPGTAISELVTAHSHPQALAQCRGSLEALGLRAVAAQDTAGAAREVAQAGDPTRGAIASRLAGEIFGLEVVREGLEDHPHNTTRFIILSGDVVHSEENFEKNTVPSLNTNTAESIASMEKIRQMIEMYKATLYINHDKKQTDTLKLLPAFYD